MAGSKKRKIVALLIFILIFEKNKENQRINNGLQKRLGKQYLPNLFLVKLDYNFYKNKLKFFFNLFRRLNTVDAP